MSLLFNKQQLTVVTLINMHRSLLFSLLLVFCQFRVRGRGRRGTPSTERVTVKLVKFILLSYFFSSTSALSLEESKLNEQKDKQQNKLTAAQ